MAQKNIFIFVIIIVLVSVLFLVYNFWLKGETPPFDGQPNATSTLPNATSTEPNATTSQPTFYPWLAEEIAPTIQYSHIDKITSVPLELVISSSSLFGENPTSQVANIAYGDFDNDSQEEAVFNIARGASGTAGLSLIYKLMVKDDITKELTNVAIDRSFSDDLQKGYQGHLGFVVLNNLLIESFPLYKEGDANCCPSDGLRYILYKWDEPNKKLVVDKAIDLEPEWFAKVKDGQADFGDVLEEALKRFGL